MTAERAIRQASALLVSSHISVIELSGNGAFECLDRLVACDLFLYDGQARQTVILDELGSVIADVTVAKVDGALRLFVDGLTAAELRALIDAPAGVELRDLLEEHALVSLHGPFAWELAAIWLGRAVVSLPPLGLYRTGSGVVMRAGKTGEFGYETLVPLPLLESARDRLLSAGQAVGLLEVPLEVVDRCVLENGGYVARAPGLAGLSPFELQLQWRTSPRKPYRGRAAAEQRSTPSSKRVAWFNCLAPITAGTKLALEGDACGEVLLSAAAPARDGAFGLALIERRFSHPGLRFEADRNVVVHTASPPLVEPWSTRVRPEVDSYATLDPARFAPRGAP